VLAELDFAFTIEAYLVVHRAGFVEELNSIDRRPLIKLRLHKLLIGHGVLPSIMSSHSEATSAKSFLNDICVNTKFAVAGEIWISECKTIFTRTATRRVEDPLRCYNIYVARVGETYSAIASYRWTDYLGGFLHDKTFHTSEDAREVVPSKRNSVS
jgi:hypothetical protein